MELASKIKVLVAGAAGRMGRQVCRAVWEQEDMELTAAVDPAHAGENIGLLAGLPGAGPVVGDRLGDELKHTRPDVVVDFTESRAVMENARQAAAGGAYLVIGTTGLTSQQMDELHLVCEQHQVAALVAPNFAMGAVLMMRFARQAARFLPGVEIIELHHDQKKDAPSGTALKTAEEIWQDWVGSGRPRAEEEKLPGVRGGDYQGIKIHSVRLPGLVAHQEVILGGTGEVLTIRHDSLSRESFMPGVLLGIRRIRQARGLIYGLDKIMDLA